jgi:Ca2+-binding RTX toxin-like protein
MATFIATSGNDVFNGSIGVNDTVDYSDATAAGSGIAVDLSLAGAQATGGSGSDIFVSIEDLIATRFDDVITAVDGNAHNIQLGDGDDEVAVFRNADNFADGGTGNDELILSFDESTTAHLRFVNGSTTISDAGTYLNFETIAFANLSLNQSFHLGPGAVDFFYNKSTGTSGTDIMFGGYVLPGGIISEPIGLEADGGLGDDYIYGTDIYDILKGGGGNDYLFGGDGGDRLEGGDGNDILDGGQNHYNIPPDQSIIVGDLLMGGKGDDIY